MTEQSNTYPVGAMSDAILNEVADHLDAAARDGTERIIDLRSLPMAEADQARLRDRLGTGETCASVTGTGRSDIQETAFAGVWWIRHLDAAGRLLMEEISVSPVPGILCADARDMTAAAGRLRTPQATTTDEGGRPQ